MYAQGNYKGAKNEWLPSMDSIGVPSYINVQAYWTFTHNIFSLLACLTLHCPTFLHIPATHMLFSLATCSQITYQDLTTANGHPLILINLCSFLLGMFQTLSAQSGIIKTLVNNLIKQLKSSKNAARENVVPDHVLGPEAEESSELDEESVEKQNQ